MNTTSAPQPSSAQTLPPIVATATASQSSETSTSEPHSTENHAQHQDIQTTTTTGSSQQQQSSSEEVQHHEQKTEDTQHSTTTTTQRESVIQEATSEPQTCCESAKVAAQLAEECTRKESSSEGDAATTMASMDVLVPLEERLINVVEIYNVELSPTSISIAFDTILKTNVILKKIFKTQLDSIQKVQAALECEVTCKLHHFNLMRGIQAFENDVEFSMLVEFINDADYFSEKVENCHKPIKNELKLKSYMADIFNGLEYIHSQGYIHCDLKLANLFCEQQENDAEDVSIRRVKIGDFGLIQRMDSTTRKAHLEETCGTFGFKAPEVKKGAIISEKADIWSVGIILYLMTVAYLPHHMKGYKYGQGPIPFREFDWKKRSPELKDFVQKLLALDPEQRPTAKEALQHPFLQIE